jgi:hypothetical protein
MKGLGNLLMIVSAFIASPFLVYFVHRFIPSAYPWVPFAIVILFAGVLGIGFLRGAGFGLITGVLLFGAFLMWWHRGVSFLPPYIRTLQKPF